MILAQPLQVRIDLRVMTMKRNIKVPRFPELEFHHQKQFSAIFKMPLSFESGRVCREYSQHIFLNGADRA